MSTAFQKSVWRALTKIPKGKVTTYGDIARHIGKPKAVRAVATAVGKNPDAPAVPCHRVIPSTGSIGKYSGPGGIQQKISLLEREGVSVDKGAILELQKHHYNFA